MSVPSRPFSRRTLLRGAGAALALPLLESMAPAAEPGVIAVKPKRDEPPKPPVRMGFYIVGGGAYMPYWSLDDSGRTKELTPQESVEYKTAERETNEPLGKLSPSLELLEKHKQDVVVFSGLTLADPIHQFEDGHSPEIATLLTASTLSSDRVSCGVSIDQFAAQRLEGKTYLDSLVLGLNGARPGGSKGIGRVYAQHYSWRGPGTPTGEERNPRLAFDRLFRGQAPASGDTAAARAIRGSKTDDTDRRSVLDLVGEDAKRLRGRLGGVDRQKLDEYLSAVRDVERRLEYVAKKPADPLAPSLSPDDDAAVAIRTQLADRDIPEAYIDYDHLMVDLMVLALRTDTTRVAMLTHGGYRSYPEADVRRGHHDCQHHEGDAAKRDDLRKIDRFNVGLFAYFIERMAAVEEGTGTLLDNSMLLYASGMGNPNRHARENLPVLLAGKGGGTIRTGRHLDFNWKKMTPLANLYVEMLNRAGVPVKQFGDSRGGLPGLA